MKCKRCDKPAVRGPWILCRRHKREYEADQARLQAPLVVPTDIKTTELRLMLPDERANLLRNIAVMLYGRLSMLSAHVEQHQRIVKAFRSGERPSEGNESDSNREVEQGIEDILKLLRGLRDVAESLGEL